MVVVCQISLLHSFEIHFVGVAMAAGHDLRGFVAIYIALLKLLVQMIIIWVPTRRLAILSCTKKGTSMVNIWQTLPQNGDNQRVNKVGLC